MLAIVWSWWAAKDGAFFETVLLPGTILLCATTALLAWTAPWRGSLWSSRPATIALALPRRARRLGGAVGALEPDAGHRDRRRPADPHLRARLRARDLALHPAGRRMHLALVPLAVAGGVRGRRRGRRHAQRATTSGAISTTARSNSRSATGTRTRPSSRSPCGRRWGWPRTAPVAWPVRAAALATATLCLDLAMLSQSRASLAGGAAALAVYLLFSAGPGPQARMAGARRPPGAADPPVADRPLPARERATPRCAPRSASCAGRGARSRSPACGSLAIGAVAALVGTRMPASPRRVEIADRAALVGLVAAVLAGSVAFVAAVGNPVDWIDKRVSQLGSGRGPDLRGESSRFSSLSTGTRRAGDLASGAAGRARSPPARRRRGRLPLHATCENGSRTPPGRFATRTASSSRTCRNSASRDCCCSPAPIGAARPRGDAGPPAGAGAGLVVDLRPDGRRLLARALLARLVLALPGAHRSRFRPARLRLRAGAADRRRRAPGSRSALADRSAPWRSRSRRSPRSSATATSTTLTTSGGPTRRAPTTTSTGRRR